MEEVLTAIEKAIGGGGSDIGMTEMALRAAIVYVAALAMVRVGGKRFLGQPTAFDAVLGIIFGSVVSRAITGNAPFLPALGAGMALVALHSLLAVLALRAPAFGAVIEGRPRLLVERGRMNDREMRRSRMSPEDIREGVRLAAGTDDLARVEAAHLERNGRISVIKAASEPKVLQVELGGQAATVRILLE